MLRLVFAESPSLPWLRLRTFAAWQVCQLEVVCQRCTHVLRRPDVATLGALCGLASFDRKEVKERLLEHSEFSEVKLDHEQPNLTVAYAERKSSHLAFRFLKMRPRSMQWSKLSTTLSNRRALYVNERAHPPDTAATNLVSSS